MTAYIDRVRIAREIRNIKTDTGGFVKALSDALGLPWTDGSGNIQTRLYNIKDRLATLIHDPSYGTVNIDEAVTSVERTAAVAEHEETLVEALNALRAGLGMEKTEDYYSEDLAEAVREVARKVRDAAVGSMLFPPMTADGQNVYLGDTIYDDSGKPFTVRTIIAKAAGEALVCDGTIDTCKAHSAKAYNKRKPRTLLDVENEAAGAAATGDKERARELISEAFRMGRNTR